MNRNITRCFRCLRFRHRHPELLWRTVRPALGTWVVLSNRDVRMKGDRLMCETCVGALAVKKTG